MSVEVFRSLGFAPVCEGVYSCLSPENQLTDLPKVLGAELISHDDQGTIIWSITPSGVDAARSHGSQEFDMHTDASFDAVPPRYVAMEVMHHDRFGGGIQSYIPLGQLSLGLSLKERVALATDYIWDIPTEFKSDQAEAVLPILFDHTDGVGIRFRADCIQDDNLNSKQAAALRGLNHAIARAQSTQHTIHTGEQLIVDNWRTLHARSPVLDKKRHIKRVRF